MLMDAPLAARFSSQTRTTPSAPPETKPPEWKGLMQSTADEPENHVRRATFALDHHFRKQKQDLFWVHQAYQTHPAGEKITFRHT